MSSPVFEAMFYGGLPEHDEIIEILDVTPEAFQELIEYVILIDLLTIRSESVRCEKPALAEKGGYIQTF